jgi:hypothetical protein
LNKKNIFQNYYILYDELSGDVEPGIRGIQFENKLYNKFSESLIEAIAKSESNEA